MNPRLAAARDWFDSKPPRDQLLFAVVGAALLVALYVALVWRPLDRARAAATRDIAGYDALIARARAGGPGLARRAAARPPATTVAETAAAAELAIQRLEPTAAGVTVTLQAAEFTRLIAWLDTLEREHALTATTVRLERRPAPGTVDATVELGRAA